MLYFVVLVSRIANSCRSKKDCEFIIHSYITTNTTLNKEEETRLLYCGIIKKLVVICNSIMEEDKNNIYQHILYLYVTKMTKRDVSNFLVVKKAEHNIFT